MKPENTNILFYISKTFFERFAPIFADLNLFKHCWIL